MTNQVAKMFVKEARDAVGSLKPEAGAVAKGDTRFVPPAFLLTTTASRQLGTFSRIQRAMNGSANRLSTGFPKNPCICDAYSQ